jgi:transcriptional regulator with XRE-family HTH domain
LDVDDDTADAGIGRRLRQIRLWRGLSLRVAADLAGLSASHLSRIERGERPVDRRSTLEAYAPSAPSTGRAARGC